MLETGWSDETLATATPQRIESLRWALFARAVEPIVSRDYDGEIRNIEESDRPPTKTALRARRRQAIETLRAEQRKQAEARRALELDEQPDERVGDGE